MGIAKVTTNYQVTIPRDIRTLHNISVGDTVFFAIEGSKVDFFKMSTKDALKEVAGMWKHLDPKKSSVEIVREMRREWATRERRVRA